MRPFPVVVHLELAVDAVQVPLGHDDELVQTLVLERLSHSAQWQGPRGMSNMPNRSKVLETTRIRAK
jgi:hypothetical protein